MKTVLLQAIFSGFTVSLDTPLQFRWGFSHPSVALGGGTNCQKGQGDPGTETMDATLGRRLDADERYGSGAALRNAIAPPGVFSSGPNTLCGKMSTK